MKYEDVRLSWQILIWQSVYHLPASSYLIIIFKSSLSFIFISSSFFLVLPYKLRRILLIIINTMFLFFKKVTGVNLFKCVYVCVCLRFRYSQKKYILATRMKDFCFWWLHPATTFTCCWLYGLIYFIRISYDAFVYIRNEKWKKKSFQFW